MLAGVAGRSCVINGCVVEQRRLAVAGMDWALPVVGLPFVEAAVTGIHAAQGVDRIAMVRGENGAAREVSRS